MTQQVQDQLDALNSTVLTTKGTLDQANALLTSLVNTSKEHEREAAVHTANNDTTDLQIVNGWLKTDYQNIAKQQGIVKQASSDYTAAFNAYTNAEDTLLTPEDKQALVVKAQSDASIAIADNNNKIFMQKTTQYVIIGAIALVVIGGIVWYIRRKSKVV